MRPSFRLGGRQWPFYGLFVCSGVILGSVFSLGVARASGLGAATTAIVLAAGTAAAIAFALATEVLTGREVYTFYHYQILVIAGGAGLLALLDRPVLPCLDLVGLALAVTQGIGRLGCLMAGCCHGRPHAWGVRYGEAHAEQGFEPALVGVRLFPIQAVESIGLLALAAAGAALVLGGWPAGAALATYLVGYGTLRFGLELARGDAARPFAHGLSEAQWTALAVVTSAVALEVLGLLPLIAWHLATPAALGLAAAALAARGRFRPTHRLFSPHHVLELAGILHQLAAGSAPASAAGGAPRVASTSLGIRLSGGGIREVGDVGAHYALSSRDGTMTAATAKRLAALIVRLRHPPAARTRSCRLLQGAHGVFHLLIETPPGEPHEGRRPEPPVAAGSAVAGLRAQG